jgi:hypothetical protein
MGDGRVEEWKGGRMEGWQDGRMEEWKEPIKTRTFDAYFSRPNKVSIDQRGAEGPGALQIMINASTDQFPFQAMRSPD